MTRKMLSFILAIAVSRVALAAVEPVAHYKFDEAGQVSMEIAPAAFPDASGQGHELTRQGEPRFMAGGPEGRKAGSVQFDGVQDGFELKQALLRPGENFILEAWVQAKEANAPGLHGVVSHGDGARGYTIAQEGENWVAFIGGVGRMLLQPVKEGEWTHIALVFERGRLTGYVNTERVGTSGPSTGVTANFSIGDMGGGRERFAGLIHEVRLSTFAIGKFDPTRDFLVEAERVAEIREQSAAQRRARLEKLLQGVPMVEQLSVPRYDGDWLVHRPTTKSSVQVVDDGQGTPRWC